MNVEELKAKCIAMFKQKALCARLKAEKAEQENILKDMKQDIYNALEANELKTFDTGLGKVTRTSKPYAKIVDKEALAMDLKERGLFDALYTFNATKMNSFYKEELEKAKEEGNVDFEIKGIEVSSARTDLSITGVKVNE